MVGGAGATVLGGSARVLVSGAMEAGSRACLPVELPHAANTDGLAHVDVAGDSGGTDVEPVDVLGRELVGVWWLR